MRTFKKISAIVLVVAMMLSLVSFSAFAATGDFTYKITNAKNGAEVTGVKAGTKVNVDVYFTPGTYNALTIGFNYNGELDQAGITSSTNDVSVLSGNRVLFNWASTFTVADEPVLTIPITVDPTGEDLYRT